MTVTGCCNCAEMGEECRQLQEELRELREEIKRVRAQNTVTQEWADKLVQENEDLNYEILETHRMYEHKVDEYEGDTRWLDR